MIDGIWCALTGKDVPGVPINRDSVTAKIVVGLDDGHRRLSWSAKGGKIAGCRRPDGGPVKAPCGVPGKSDRQDLFRPVRVRQPTARQRKRSSNGLRLDSRIVTSTPAGSSTGRKARHRARRRADRRRADLLVDAKNVERVDVADLLANGASASEVIDAGKQAARLEIAE